MVIHRHRKCTSEWKSKKIKLKKSVNSDLTAEVKPCWTEMTRTYKWLWHVFEGVKRLVPGLCNKNNVGILILAYSVCRSEISEIMHSNHDASVIGSYRFAAVLMTVTHFLKVMRELTEGEWGGGGGDRQTETEKLGETEPIRDRERQPNELLMSWQRSTRCIDQ